VAELAQIGSNADVLAFARNPKVAPDEVVSTILSLVKTPVGPEIKNFLAMLACI